MRRLLIAGSVTDALGVGGVLSSEVLMQSRRGRPLFVVILSPPHVPPYYYRRALALDCYCRILLQQQTDCWGITPTSQWETETQPWNKA